MPYTPSFEQFADLAADVDYVPVYRRLVSDALTPVQAFRKLNVASAACLFESVIGGEKVGRYSFLASDPFLQISARGEQVTVSRSDTRHNGSTDKSPSWKTESFECSNPLDTLREQVRAMKVALLDNLPPFVGGAVGYAGYDTVRYVERLPDAPDDDRKLPDLWFAFYDHMVVFDHITKTIVVVAMARLDGPDSDLKTAYDSACRRVDNLVVELAAAPRDLQPVDIDTSGEPRLDHHSNFTREEFEAAVRKCVEYIRAGDIFQVVFSQRLEIPLRVHPFEVYRTLREIGRAHV